VLLLQLRHYERLSVQIRQFHSNWGPVDPKFRVEGDPTHQPFFFSENRLNDLLYGIKIWTDFSFVLSQFTRLTDRHIYGHTVSNSYCSIMFLTIYGFNRFPCAYFTLQTRCEMNSQQVKTVGDRKFRNWTCSAQSRNAMWIEFCLVLTEFPICN